MYAVSGSVGRLRTVSIWWRQWLQWQRWLSSIMHEGVETYDESISPRIPEVSRELLSERTQEIKKLIRSRGPEEDWFSTMQGAASVSCSALSELTTSARHQEFRESLEDLAVRRRLTYPSEWSDILEALDHFLGRLISYRELLKQRGVDEEILSDLMEGVGRSREEVTWWSKEGIRYDYTSPGDPIDPLRTLNDLSDEVCDLQVLLDQVRELDRIEELEWDNRRLQQEREAGSRLNKNPLDDIYQPVATLDAIVQTYGEGMPDDKAHEGAYYYLNRQKVEAQSLRHKARRVLMDPH
jgi:hypothetical protein